jgi:hypothetical protein
MRYGRAIPTALLIGILAGPAVAQPDGDDERAVRRATTILLHEDENEITPPQPLDFGPAWLAHYVRLDKRSGFRYSRKLDVGDQEMSLRVKGPVVRKKRLGLSLEVRF